VPDWDHNWVRKKDGSGACDICGHTIDAPVHGIFTKVPDAGGRDHLSFAMVCLLVFVVFNALIDTGVVHL